MSDTWALIIVGAGSAGLTAAGWAVQLKARVATVERDRLAADCTPTGCGPRNGAQSRPASPPDAAHRSARPGPRRPGGRTKDLHSFEGNRPLARRVCVAQAWSVAELLRAWWTMTRQDGGKERAAKSVRIDGRWPEFDR